MLKFVVVYFAFGCSADYRLFPYKVLCGSSLDRCRRFAVAPFFGEQSEFVGASTTYFGTGLIFEGTVQMLRTGSYNHE